MDLWQHDNVRCLAVGVQQLLVHGAAGSRLACVVGHVRYTDGTAWHVKMQRGIVGSVVLCNVWWGARVRVDCGNGVCVVVYRQAQGSVTHACDCYC